MSLTELFEQDSCDRTEAVALQCGSGSFGITLLECTEGLIGGA